MKAAYRVSTRRFGMGSGRPKERRQKSLPSLIVLWSKVWPIQPCISASSSSDRSLGRGTNKHRTGSRHNRRPRSKNGGRLSKRQGSGRNDGINEYHRANSHEVVVPSAAASPAASGAV